MSTVSPHGWVYWEGGRAAGNTDWVLTAADAGFNPLHYVNSSPNPVSAGAWTFQTATYTVDSNVSYVQLYCQAFSMTGASTLRCDDGFLNGNGYHLYAEDVLGTSRVITTPGGVVCYDADFYPYGGERPYVNTCSPTYKFEGKERDAETGNDDFGARYYSNRFGRWLSSDWSAVPVAIPYANLSNPQTLNLYSMVSDDPESFADLDGHCCWEEVVGLGVGTWNFVKDTVGGTIQTAARGTATAGSNPGGELGKEVANAVFNAVSDYSDKGVSGVGAQLLGQGEEGAMEVVTEAVLTGGLAASGRVDGITPERFGAPDANVVVRGGQSEMPRAGTTFSGSQGATLEDAAQGVPHGTVRESTAGQIGMQAVVLDLSPRRPGVVL